MKIHVIALLLCAVPCMVSAATTRGEDARIGVNRVSMAGVRGISNMSVNLNNSTQSTNTGTTVSGGGDAGQPSNPGDSGGEPVGGNDNPGNENSGSCRDAYRACMDEFCLLDESEGYRCACSDNINKSRDLINEIQKIQSDADNLYTSGVEREQLGAKARLVFGESDAAKKSSRASGLSFAEWLGNGDTDDDSLGADYDIGGNLYAMASDYCAHTLQSCPNISEMEEVLYSRQIVADCKSFESYLADQKRNAESNKRVAEAAVRKARLEMLDTTNKYNRGECLLAYRSCVADKGGCGVNFENCLDVDLLGRRANACENVLDQCMAVRSYVLEDWEVEAQSILVDAAKYADRYARQTCLARIQACLEDNCSTATNSACLTDVDIAVEICPVITECEQMIPGIRSAVSDKLGYLRTQFCQNDVDKCLRDKCGANFTAPECLGKKTTEIAAFCPQSMFPSCKNETQFDIILSSVLMQMDYRLLQGCLNYFGEQLGKVCGTDMTCLPESALLAVKDDEGEYVDMSKWIDLDSVEGKKLRSAVRESAHNAVDDFFVDFEKDFNVAACQDTYSKSKTKLKGHNSLIESVYASAKTIAYQSAENRAERVLASLMDKLKIERETDLNRRYCLKKYQEENKPASSEGSYSYIRSVSYEPSLRNCHICRMQRVCETGGEDEWTSALKAGAGASAAGAAAGTMVTPGWGTAIGGVVGLLGGGVMGFMSGGEKEFCQEIESCEDLNVDDVTEEMLRDL